MQRGSPAAGRRILGAGRLPPARQAGFTLAELAIVAVIAGLIVGFIVQGQALVVQARIKDLSNELVGASQAFSLYFDRYRAVPGDDPLAEGRWAGARNGNGDRVLSGRYNDPAPGNPMTMTIDTTTGETLNFWWHLRRAGLIPASETPHAQPINAMGGLIGVQGSGLGFGFPIVCVDNIPGHIAEALDSSLDDGKPDKGMVRAALSPASGQPLGAAVAAYTATGGVLYAVCRPIDR
ncbi:MAG: type II secretion system GspH family protein [Burkholderiales bacterium]|nr:type II secretion system GspH family protein [Burkholderiales bacterium]